MNQLRMIVPVNNDTLLSPEHRQILTSLGHESEWMLGWVLEQWPLMRAPHSVEVYDRLYQDMEELIHGYNLDEEGDARKLDAILEENMDQIAEAAQSVYTRLIPFVGMIPNQVRRVQTDSFGLNDTVLTFEMEEAA